MVKTEREWLDLWRLAVTAGVRSDAPDLTARQQAILMSIALMPGPHTVRGLSLHLDVAKPAVTRALDALEKLGFVRRLRDESDLRSVLIERTQEGMDYLRALGKHLKAAESGMSEASQPVDHLEDVQAA